MKTQYQWYYHSTFLLIITLLQSKTILKHYIQHTLTPNSLIYPTTHSSKTIKIPTNLSNTFPKAHFRPPIPTDRSHLPPKAPQYQLTKPPQSVGQIAFSMDVRNKRIHASSIKNMCLFVEPARVLTTPGNYCIFVSATQKRFIGSLVYSFDAGFYCILSCAILGFHEFFGWGWPRCGLCLANWIRFEWFLIFKVDFW